MCLSSPTYEGFCSYIEGFDFAVKGRVLDDLYGWLRKQTIPHNLSWSYSFLYLIFPDAKHPVIKIRRSKRNNEIAITRLVAWIEVIARKPKGPVLVVKCK